MHLLKRTVFRLFVASLAVLALGACGGDEEKGGPSQEQLSQLRATQIAHIALLSQDDLTGEWTTFSTDNFRNDDASLPDTGNCAAARTLAMDMTKENKGRAARALQLTVPGYSSKAQVEMHIRVFDKDKTAGEFLKRHRTLLTGDGYIRCLSDGFTALFGANARVRFGDARSKAPRDGVTAAFDQDIKVGEEIVQLHTDSYSWIQGNIYVVVLITGPRVADSGDVVKESLDKVQQKVEVALKLPE